MGSRRENKAWAMGEVKARISRRKNVEESIALNSKISPKEQRLNQ